ncbi:MAG: hypothetical protein Fur003_2590 [Candidatus Dojkabacteria bacterium]
MSDSENYSPLQKNLVGIDRIRFGISSLSAITVDLVSDEVEEHLFGNENKEMRIAEECLNLFTSVHEYLHESATYFDFQAKVEELAKEMGSSNAQGLLDAYNDVVEECEYSIGKPLPYSKEQIKVFKSLFILAFKALAPELMDDNIRYELVEHEFGKLYEVRDICYKFAIWALEPTWAKSDTTNKNLVENLNTLLSAFKALCQGDIQDNSFEFAGMSVEVEEHSGLFYRKENYQARLEAIYQFAYSNKIYIPFDSISSFVQAINTKEFRQRKIGFLKYLQKVIDVNKDLKVMLDNPSWNTSVWILKIADELNKSGRGIEAFTLYFYWLTELLYSSKEKKLSAHNLTKFYDLMQHRPLQNNSLIKIWNNFMSVNLGGFNDDYAEITSYTKYLFIHLVTSNLYYSWQHPIKPSKLSKHLRLEDYLLNTLFYKGFISLLTSYKMASPSQSN